MIEGSRFEICVRSPDGSLEARLSFSAPTEAYRNWIIQVWTEAFEKVFNLQQYENPKGIKS